LIESLWIGPEGGDGGGEILAAGTPEDIVKVKRSYTGAGGKKKGLRRRSSANRRDIPLKTIALQFVVLYIFSIFARMIERTRSCAFELHS
jgi:hypothetical protein